MGGEGREVRERGVRGEGQRVRGKGRGVEHVASNIRRTWGDIRRQAVETAGSLGWGKGALNNTFHSSRCRAVPVFRQDVRGIRQTAAGQGQTENPIGDAKLHPQVEPFQGRYCIIVF